MHGFGTARSLTADLGVAQPATGLFANAGRTNPDYESALKWARAAAEAGASDAQALLGYILTAGPETIRDLWMQRTAGTNAQPPLAARKGHWAMPCLWHGLVTRHKRLK